MNYRTAPDLTAPSFPSKDGLYFLLGLSRDPSKDEFLTAWDKAVAPAKNGDWAKAIFNRYIENLQREKGLTFNQAWEVADQLPEGRKLGAAYRAEAEAKKRM